MESGQIQNGDYVNLRGKDKQPTEISFYLLTAYYYCGCLCN